MTAPARQTASAAPDVPEEVLRRRPIALTPMAAESTPGAEEREGLTLPGASGIGSSTPRQDAAAKARQAKAAKKAAGGFAEYFKHVNGAPHAGLTIAQIMEISGKSYPGQPAMDGTLGDKTPAFVRWLCKNHPKDAAVRFAYRDIDPKK